jgi:ABC-type glycerol-3-phosphate transport system substrate-binding protein
MKKRAALVIMILIAAAGMAFATGRSEGGPVTLRFSWWSTDARHEATLKGEVLNLGKKNPGPATLRLSGESRIYRNAPDNLSIVNFWSFAKLIFGSMSPFS